jgi:hypothetical protein
MTELFSKMMDPDPRGYEKEENDLIIFFNWKVRNSTNYSSQVLPNKNFGF